jgi:hypothetical protein
MTIHERGFSRQLLRIRIKKDEDEKWQKGKNTGFQFVLTFWHCHLLARVIWGEGTSLELQFSYL